MTFAASLLARRLIQAASWVSVIVAAIGAAVIGFAITRDADTALALTIGVALLVVGGVGWVGTRRLTRIHQRALEHAEASRAI